MNIKLQSAEEVILWVLNIIKRQRGIDAYGLVSVIKLDLRYLISKDPNSPSISDIVSVIIRLEREWKALEIVEKRSSDEEYGLKFNWDHVVYFLLEINREKFDKIYKKYKTEMGKRKGFLLRIKDREIFVNNYLIARPHATGNNLEFFEYVRKNPNKKIEEKNLIDDLRVALGNKTFFKILNGLGFKKEITKAFFYKVSNNILFYRGDTLTPKQLEEAGVDIKTFIKQLEAANAKFNPI